MNTRTYDPFGWRLDELAAPNTTTARRAELRDELLVAEAEELALGRRHLTIIHGEPLDIAESEALNDLYDAVATIVEPADWYRLTGGMDRLTVTVAGADREAILAEVADLAARSSGPGDVLLRDGPVFEPEDI